MRHWAREGTTMENTRGGDVVRAVADRVRGIWLVVGFLAVLPFSFQIPGLLDVTKIERVQAALRSGAATPAEMATAAGLLDSSFAGLWRLRYALLFALAYI